MGVLGPSRYASALRPTGVGSVVSSPAGSGILDGAPAENGFWFPLPSRLGGLGSRPETGRQQTRLRRSKIRHKEVGDVADKSKGM